MNMIWGLFLHVLSGATRWNSQKTFRVPSLRNTFLDLRTCYHCPLLIALSHTWYYVAFINILHFRALSYMEFRWKYDIIYIVILTIINLPQFLKYPWFILCYFQWQYIIYCYFIVSAALSAEMWTITFLLGITWGSGRPKPGPGPIGSA